MSLVSQVGVESSFTSGSRPKSEVVHVARGRACWEKGRHCARLRAPV